MARNNHMNNKFVAVAEFDISEMSAWTGSVLPVGSYSATNGKCVLPDGALLIKAYYYVDETFSDDDATEVSYTGIQKHLESIENLLNQMEEKHDLKTWEVRPDRLKYMGSERYMQRIINFSVDVVATSLKEAQDIVRDKHNLNPWYFTFKTTEK